MSVLPDVIILKLPTRNKAFEQGCHVFIEILLHGVLYGVEEKTP